MKKILLLVLFSGTMAYGQANPQTGRVNGLALNSSQGCASLFGDSIFSGTSSANSNLQQYNSTLPGRIQSSVIHDCGVNASYNGLEMDQIVHNEYLYYVAPQQAQTITKVFLEGGINDAIAFNNGGTPTANALNQINQVLIAEIAWAATPPANIYPASTWTQTTGTWSASGPFGYNSSFSGNEVGNAVNSSVLTSPTITTTVANQKIGLLWGANSGGGTFTFSIDGSSQTALCSGTTSFASAGCNFSNGNGVLGQEFTVASAGTHTLVVTKTNAAQVDIVAAYLVPATPLSPTSTSGAVVWVSGVPPGYNTQSAAITTAKTAYNTRIASVVATESAEYGTVFFADVRNQIGPSANPQVINNTTDYVATSGCYVNPGLTPDHPDCQGIDKWAQAFIAAAPPGVMYPGIGQVIPSDYPILGNGTADWGLPIINRFTIQNTPAASYATYQQWSSLSGPIGGNYYTYGSATTHGPGLFTDSNGSSTFHGIEGSFYDTTAATNYGFGLISSNGWLFENCTAAAVGDSNCTKEAELTSAGNLIVLGSLKVATARKGTFVCTAAGTITIANTNELVTSDVIISLNTAGGTISTAPAMKTVTSGTGFTVLCGAADTSTYNYTILN